jgi:acetyl esterase/lipase
VSSPKKTGRALKFLLLILSAVYAQSLIAQQTPNDPTEGVPKAGRVKGKPGKEYVYKTVNGTPIKMEAYFPKDWEPSQNRTCILLFHGGGWSGGDLDQFRYDGEYFAGRGAVFMTANYRMNSNAEAKAFPSGVSRKRICVTDARSAIRWCKQKAGELGIDPDKIVTGGSSAGAHLSIMASLGGSELDDPNDPKEFSTKVAAHLLFSAAFVAPGGDKDDAVDVFAQLKRPLAPTIFYEGDRDGWKKGVDLLMPKLLAAGDEVILKVAVGQSHVFNLVAPWKNACLADADKFLVDHGLLKGVSTLKVDPHAVLKTEVFSRN